jgi:putative endonuclease
MADGVWYLYVLECGDASLYCGITTDVTRRVAQHEAGKGARYTKGRGPLKLLREWPCGGRSEALKAELAFKRLSKEAKWSRVGEGGLVISGVHAFA